MMDPAVRVFRLNRLEDATGISGTGIVAQGLLAQDGSVAMRWLTEHRSWCIYDSILEVYAIHGHDGQTIIELYDEKGGWVKWTPKREWIAASQRRSSTSKTGSKLHRMRLTPWEVLPKKIQAKARMSSKLLTDTEIGTVEHRLTSGPGRKRSKLPTDERLASLEETMTRRSTVRAVEEATEEALRSRHFKY